jgi:tetratricopeptide (TPR) repeat protein
MKPIAKTFLLVALGITLLPQGTAFMSSPPRAPKILGETPNPPSSGRIGESSGARYLTPLDIGFTTWMKRGKTYLSRKEFEQAVLAFRKALQTNPLSADAHFLLGYAYERRSKEGLPGDQTAWDILAERSYRSAIAAGDHLPARFNLGMLLSRTDRAPEARREWEHILTISPGTRLGRLAKNALERNQQADFLPSIFEQDINTLSQ